MLRIEDLLGQGFDYVEYARSQGLWDVLGTGDESRNQKVRKAEPSVLPSHGKVLGPEMGDLARLHYLVRSRRVLNVLEFGVGKSTAIMADALFKNKIETKEKELEMLRREKPFRIYAVDNYKRYIRIARKNLKKHILEEKIVHFHHAAVKTTTFMGKVCTMYGSIPNICPDMIYLDGPDQFSAIGTIRGISTRCQDRMPMSADILAIEHFLQPGTLIVIDGRTANARFLKCNLQREWGYVYSKELDQHFFELQEEPLGVHNERMLSFFKNEKCTRQEISE